MIPRSGPEFRYEPTPFHMGTLRPLGTSDCPVDEQVTVFCNAPTNGVI